jgi:hypothetical protein
MANYVMVGKGEDMLRLGKACAGRLLRGLLAYLPIAEQHLACCILVKVWLATLVAAVHVRLVCILG